jgi:hypothetical protein
MYLILNLVLIFLQSHLFIININYDKSLKVFKSNKIIKL